MSYLVIARKWRPNLFDEIIGQEHVTKTLSNAVSTGRTAHAYLFSGPRGVGKTTAARILAKCVNCASGPTATPCNSCEICSSITAGSCVDVIEIDGASNTSVDNIRELKENIRFVPGACKYKVYIIDEVHMLSTAAFNALLKTLEEPPPHTLFIFATTEVHKIPRTILSRCQRFDFKRIPFKQIRDHLAHIAGKEGIKITGGVLEIISREADGSMRDAESLLDQTIAYAGLEITEEHVSEALGLMDRSLLFDLTEAVLSGDGAACLKIVEKAFIYGYDLKKVCLELIEHVREMSVLKAMGNASLLELPDTELRKLEKLTESVSDGRLQLLFSILSSGYDDVSRALTPRFSLEMTLLKAARAGELRPISELINTLDGYMRSGAGRSAIGAGAGVPKESVGQGKPIIRQAVTAKEELPWKRPGGVVAASAKPRVEEAEPSNVVERASEPGAVWQTSYEQGAARTGNVSPPAVLQDEPAVSAPSPGKADVSGRGGDKNIAGLVEFIIVEKKNRLLGSALKNAGAVLEGGEIVIKNGGSSSMVFDHRAEIEKYCLEFFSKVIKLSAAGSESKVTAPQKPQTANTNAAPESDTIVKEAIRILGGRVVDDSRRTDV